MRLTVNIKFRTLVTPLIALVSDKFVFLVEGLLIRSESD